MQIEVGTHNLDATKARLEMALVSSIPPVFSHAMSNAIQSCPIVQVIEWLPFEFHHGQNKTQACPNHSNLQMCPHLNHQTHSLHQMDLRLQIESKKGENVPKQKQFPTRRLKSKFFNKKKWKGGNQKPNN
jgi:hypothetical protein